EALNALFPGFGASQQPALVAAAVPGTAQPGATGSLSQAGAQAAPTPGASQTSPVLAPPANTAEAARLARQAPQLFSDYGRLAAQGRYQEAGQKLDQLKQTLDELVRKQGGG